jgi:predicted ArsR family transcriptional regulator
MIVPAQMELLPAARRTDPRTSHAAAAGALKLQSAHQRQVLECLRRFGPMGKDQIGRMTGIGGVAAARRLTELQRLGAVEWTGQTVASDSGRAEREWRFLLYPA